MPTRTALGGMDHEGLSLTLIDEHVEKPFVLGEIRYLLAFKWYYKLLDYYERSPMDSDGNLNDSNPGPIDNSPLLAGDGQLLTNLMPEVDFVLVGKELWNLLVMHYSLKEGQTAISRRIVPTGQFTPYLKAELYPVDIIFQLNFDWASNKMSDYSLNDTVGTLHDLLRKKYRVEEHTLSRLWACSFPGIYDDLNVEYNSNTVPILTRAKMLVLQTTPSDGQRTFPEKSLPMEILFPEAYDLIQDGELCEPNLGERMDLCKWAHIDCSPESVPMEIPEKSEDLTEEGSKLPLLHEIATKIQKQELSPTCRGRSLNMTTRNWKPRGVCGLVNLGLSCYMNAAIQCMSNCYQLTLFFLENLHHKDMQAASTNCGATGKIAKAYGDLIKRMWSGECPALLATEVQMAVKEVNSSFSAASHQDAQEWLVAFMNCLHNDLNRAVKGSMRPVSSALERTDKELANDAWELLIQTDDSIIVDTFFGLFRSRLTCANCDKSSSKFEAFESLHVPLAKKTALLVKVILFVQEQSKVQKHTAYKMLVPLAATVQDLTKSLSVQCGIPPEQLLLTEVQEHRIRKVFDLNEPIAAIRKMDEIYAFQCPETFNTEGQHFSMVPVCFWAYDPSGNSYDASYLFGYPMLFFMPCDELTHKSIYDVILKQMHGLYTSLPRDNKNMGQGDTITGDSFEDLLSTGSIDAENVFTLHAVENDDENLSQTTFVPKGSRLQLSDHLNEVSISIAVRMTRATKSLLYPKKTAFPGSVYNDPNMVHLLDCIQFFTSEEKMTDPRKCDSCGVLSIPNKKVDLWSVPQSLIIVMKRFGVVGNAWRKITKAVSIPIDLDLSGLVVGPNAQSAKYTLTSVCNHIGNVDRGHYTVHAQNVFSGKWYLFDDDLCSVIKDQKKIIDPTDAYMMVYKRKDIV